MSMFVHLTSDKNIASIQRNGVKGQRIHLTDINYGIFCMPVIDDFFATHQWMRELKRFNKKNIVGIYFKIPDDELVWGGFYFEEPKQYLANEVVKEFLKLDNRLGFQVILPRKIAAKDIVGIKHFPKLSGWRYYPNAHERRLCLCPACLGKGEYKSAKIRQQKYYQLISRLRKTDDEVEKTEILSKIDDIVQFSRGQIKNHQLLLPFLQTQSSKIIIRVISALASFRSEDITEILLKFLDYDDYDVKTVTADAIFRLKGKKGFEYLKPYENDSDLKELIAEYKDVYDE